jgi:hypothetical protein
MSSRKKPYRHPVSGHYRNGKYIDNYERGHGEKPKAPTRSVNPQGRGGNPGFNVTFYFPDGRETYNVGGGTLTGALREAIPQIQRPVVPTHAQIRRIK